MSRSGLLTVSSRAFSRQYLVVGEQSVSIRAGSESISSDRRARRTAAMPTLNVLTNVPVDGVVQSDILKDASKAIARILGKPESYVMIIIRGGIPISFGGTEEPAAYGELVSIGGINPANNKKVSAAISELFESKLSVPASRFYIKFDDVKGSDMGYKGSTF